MANREGTATSFTTWSAGFELSSRPDRGQTLGPHMIFKIRSSSGRNHQGGRHEVTTRIRQLLVVVCCGVLGAALLVIGVASSAAGAATSSRLHPAAVPSVGCHAGSTAKAGQVTKDFAAAGDQGSYILDVPAGYRSHNPMPLVFDLHGYADPANVQEAITQLGAYGDSHGFITVTPQVDYRVPRWDTTLGSKDLRFLGDLLTTVEHSACVDRRRVYFTGYSDGAFMTSSVACQFSARVAAVATVAGIQDAKGCKPRRPVPVVAFHGTADPFVPYSGGVGKAALALPAPGGSGKTIGQEIKTNPKAALGVQSVPAATSGWARRNGCGSRPRHHRVAKDVTLIIYRCPRHASVELYRVAGGGHTWPGSKVSASLAAVTGRTTFSISADQVMWNFFRSHPLVG